MSQSKAIKIIFGFLLLGLCYIPPGSLGQTVPFRFSHITTRDGLTSSSFYSIYKDSQGFMWFVGLGGLNRYDGYTVKAYNRIPEETDTLVLGFCAGIIEDEQNNLWVGTHSYGLLKFNKSTETFTRYYHQPENNRSLSRSDIRTLYRDRQGVLWIGTIFGGLNRFHAGDESFSCYYPDTAEPYLDCNSIYSLLEDDVGTFWVGTRNGLFTFDRTTGQFTKIHPDPDIPAVYNTFHCILQDFEGNLWFGTYLGLYKYNPKSQEWTYLLTEHPRRPNTIEENTIFDIQDYNSGDKQILFIATQGGGFKILDYTTHQLDHYYFSFQCSDGILSNRTGPIYLDENNFLWIGGGGINKASLSPNPFQHMILKSVPDSLCQITTTCFLEDHEGYLWIGTYDNGIFRFTRDLEFAGNYQPTVNTKGNFSKEYKNSIIGLFEDSTGHLWVNSQNYGVSVFDRKNVRFVPVPFDTVTGDPVSMDVFKVVEDSEGFLWFASESGLYFCRSETQIPQQITLLRDPELAQARVLDLVEDSRQNLWIITMGNGIYMFPPGCKTPACKLSVLPEYDRKPLTSKDIIREICESGTGDLWFRSESQLYFLDTISGSIRKYNSLPRELIGMTYKMTTDRSGKLWLIADKGLTCYTPGKVSTGQTVRNFTIADGLPFDEINHFSFYTDRRGFIYSGGFSGSGNGFFRFHPDSIPSENKNIPPIVITDFSVLNEPMLLDTAISIVNLIALKHNQNFFSFEFAALDYIHSSENQYAYQLEGYDASWIYSGTRHYASYTGVPPGNYIFRVKGSNNDGTWNEQGASIRISISSPPWKTWWSFTSYGLFVVAVILLVTRYYLKRRELIYKLHLERVHSEKQAEIDRLKSRFFANISHEFRTPLTLILGPIKKLKATIESPGILDDLDIMQRNAVRLQRLIEQLLSLSRIEAGQMKVRASEANLVPFVKGYLGSFESAAKQKNIHLNFRSAQSSIAVWFDPIKWKRFYTIFIQML